jgi:hypothetical protein
MNPALRERLFGADRGGYRDSGWSGRGRKKKDDDTPLSLADFEGVDAEKLSPQKQEVSCRGGTRVMYVRQVWGFVSQVWGDQ